MATVARLTFLIWPRLGAISCYLVPLEATKILLVETASYFFGISPVPHLDLSSEDMPRIILTLCSLDHGAL